MDKNRSELLKSIDFGGNRAKTNQYAAKFQQMYYSDELFTNWDRKQKAVKDYDSDQYLQYLDTIQQKSRELYDRFVAENHPDEESKKWALLFNESDYYRYLSWYVRDHREANNIGWDNGWDVPIGLII